MDSLRLSDFILCELGFSAKCLDSSSSSYFFWKILSEISKFSEFVADTFWSNHPSVALWIRRLKEARYN